MKHIPTAILKAITAIAIFVLGAAAAAIYLSLKSIKFTETSQYWTYVGAIATCASSTIAALGVVVSAWSFRSQVKQSNTLLDVDMLLKLNAEFDSDHMHKLRASAAVDLRNSKTERSDSIDRILDFFELVALLEQRGAISTWFVWHSFYHWIFHYHHLTASYRADGRSADDTIWADFEALYKKLLKHQEEQRPGSPARPTRSEEGDFLNEEARLTVHAGTST